MTKDTPDINFLKLDRADRDFLEQPISMEEVKRSVRNCSSSKAPGPDGFNFNFIKRTWEIIKGVFFMLV